MSSRQDPFREKMRRAARRPPDDAALLRSILRDINSSISRLCTIDQRINGTGFDALVEDAVAAIGRLETSDETTVVSKEVDSE